MNMRVLFLAIATLGLSVEAGPSSSQAAPLYGYDMQAEGGPGRTHCDVSTIEIACHASVALKTWLGVTGTTTATTAICGPLTCSESGAQHPVPWHQSRGEWALLVATAESRFKKAIGYSSR
jgi:hypothetical protein